MFGCLVGTISMLVAAIFRIIAFLLMLMITSISSLFIGVDEATDRIAESWLEQSAGAGFNIGYNQAARDGAKAAAGFMLVVGWALDIAVIWWLVTQFA